MDAHFQELPTSATAPTRRWQRAALTGLLAAAGLCVTPLRAAAQEQPPASGEPAPTEQTPTTDASTPPEPRDPKDDSELTDESVEEARESLKQNRSSKVLYPSERPTVEPALPPSTIDAVLAAGLPALDPDAPRPPLLPEGAFLVRRRGVLMATDWGAHIFAFAPDETGARMRPMVVLPCDTLRRMESAASATQDGRGPASNPDARVVVIGHFILTGQVTAYRGRNCVTPTAFSLADDGTKEAASPAPGPKSGATDQPVRKPEDDPEVDALIGDLESLKATPRTSAPIPEPPSGGEDQLIAEGTAIARRKGRLVRAPRGEVAIAFDSGVEGREDPPMLLLPCAATEGLERAVVRYGDNTPFEFSGRVFTYQGRNYLLPLMYVAESSRNIKTLR